MKKLLFVYLITNPCFASVPLLKVFATDSYVSEFAVEDVIRVGRNDPHLQCLFAERYLLQQGYHREASIINPEASLYIESDLTEEKTTFFGEGEEEGHERHTLFPRQPCVQDETGQS